MWMEVQDAEGLARDDLIDQLRALNILYLGRRRDYGSPPAPERVDCLIVNLATSRDARLRTALVALLLRHPEYAPLAEQAADSSDAPESAMLIRASILVAAALQCTWAFSLDLYCPGWRRIEAHALAARVGVPSPTEDYGRATLIGLDRLLGAGDAAPPDYLGAWEDVGRHVLAGLREEAHAHGPG